MFNLLSIMKFLDEFKTNKLEISINILKKFENSSLTKLSKNIFSVVFALLKIMAIVIIIINKDKLNIKLKLFLRKTPNIKIDKIDNAKKRMANMGSKVEKETIMGITAINIYNSLLTRQSTLIYRRNKDYFFCKIINISRPILGFIEL